MGNDTLTQRLKSITPHIPLAFYMNAEENLSMMSVPLFKSVPNSSNGQPMLTLCRQTSM